MLTQRWLNSPGDPLARARHLALSTDQADGALAAALEDASVSAEAQGAPIVAAELGEHALRLTPAEESVDADRRALAAARAHLAAGDVERGRLLASELVARASPGAGRAEALAVLGDIESEEPGRAVPQLREALLEPGVTRSLQASIHQRLSLIVRFTEGLDEAERHASASVELAAELGDPVLRAAGMAGLALIRFNAGKPGALQLAEEACRLAPDRLSQARADADFSLAHILVWWVQHERARPLLERLYRDWSERDERLAAYALWYLALAELRAGRMALAGEYAERARELSVQYARDGLESPQSLLPGALVAAQRGELERARTLAERSCRLTALHGSLLSAPRAVLAVVELWSGDPEAAVAGFAAAEPGPVVADGVDPGMTWWRAEQVEALLELGLVDEAVERLGAWEADARRLDRSWVLAHATRCRGLVAAAQGDVEAALLLLAEAGAQHEAVGDPFGRSRALLALGLAGRRAKQKRRARDAIEAARAGFLEIDAAGWAERAREELGRIGGRTRVEGLTPAEHRVADLVVRDERTARSPRRSSWPSVRSQAT